MPRPRRSVLVVIALIALLAIGCDKQRPERLPGETDITISGITIQGENAAPLQLAHGDLFMQLGLRKGSLIISHRYFNEFRLAEDRRRLESWWQNYGYFDVEVNEPKLDWEADRKSVAVTWTVKEGKAYRIGSVEIRHSPPGYEKVLPKYVPFSAGDRIDLETYRYARHDMAWRLQRDGYGHCIVYSRAFVDKSEKKVHWVYYVDKGPTTTIGKITVEGTNKVDREHVLDRAGIAAGDPYSLDLKENIELDLLDTGAYGSVVVKPLNADVERVLPGVRPDTGGELKEEQVDKDGKLVPRKLDEKIDFRLVVVEAPSEELRARLGAEADPTRGDVYTGASLFFRNLFGAYQHLVLEGRVGYGILWSGEEDESSGAYGDALVRYVNAGMLGRLVDFRMTGRYRDVLYPDSRLREISGGPGFRAKLARTLWLDFDALYRWEKDLGYGPFAQATRDAFDLPDDDTAHGVELDAGINWDARNDTVEPTKGHLLALRTAWSPGGGDVSTHRYVLLAPEARGFLPLNDSWSLGLRSSFSWVLGADDSGVPLGPRLFGGGAWGLRGFGRDRLSPEAESELIGGLSLSESSLELRWLPFRKTFGFVAFGDVGGAGPNSNPFADGTSVAVGLGPRLRLWYLPIALDASFRLVDHDELGSAKSLDSYLVFLRIGEAF
jgi:outer membrane protein assembly factor BamA